MLAKKNFKFFYLLLFLNIFPFFTLGSNIYQLNDDSFNKIPQHYFQYLEGYSHDIDLQILSKANWNNNLRNQQSIVEGYWVKYIIINNSNFTDVGFFFNYNTEKKIVVENSFGIKEYKYWNLYQNQRMSADHLMAHRKVFLPKNEISTIYAYFRVNPFLRYFPDNEGVERTYISNWNNVFIREMIALGIEIFLTLLALSFSIYYLFYYIVAKDDFIWISLTLFSISVFLSNGNIGLYLGYPKILSIGGSSLSNIPICISFLCCVLFFRNILKLKNMNKKLYSIFNAGIIFFSIMIPVYIFESLDWPNTDKNLNLIASPPDGLGEGIVPIGGLVCIWGIFALITLITSFLWRKKNPSFGYLCISMILPISIPIIWVLFFLFEFYQIWEVKILFFGFSQFVFLSMFILFGFVVAQNFNILKQDLINHQSKANKILENTIKERTADLTKANLMITDSINSASAIQNAILPEIDADSHGFREFKYVWEPRDIVGGDFYWIGQKEDWTSLIVADCTGHGIPGAFMTLISSTLLDRVANLSDLSQPDRILDQLDELLESTLKYREGGKTNFGLDCGIICFSQKHNLLRYAGAKTNLYQKIDEEVVEIKGDKKSLGYERKRASNQIQS